MHQFVPTIVPAPYDNGHPETWNRAWFNIFAVLIQGGLFALVCFTDDFKLVLSLGGAIAGSCIIMLFPAMFYLKIHNWRYDSLYDKTVWLIGGIGVLTFIINTSIIIIQHVSAQNDGHSNNFYDEQNKDMFSVIGRTLAGKNISESVFNQTINNPS